MQYAARRVEASEQTDGYFVTGGYEALALPGWDSALHIMNGDGSHSLNLRRRSSRSRAPEPQLGPKNFRSYLRMNIHESPPIAAGFCMMWPDLRTMMHIWSSLFVIFTIKFFL